MKKITWLILVFSGFSLLLIGSNRKDISKENWMVHPNFKEYQAGTIAVVPMINMSLEKNLGKILQKELPGLCRRCSELYQKERFP